jgi:hypothetical protein
LLPWYWANHRIAEVWAPPLIQLLDCRDRIHRCHLTRLHVPAATHGLDLNMLRTWSQFAEEHPKVATALAYKPSLINDPGYLTKHHELATFFQTHPDIKDAIEENPGNFAAIPRRPGE